MEHRDQAARGLRRDALAVPYLRRPRLIALTVGGAALETLILQVTGAVSALGLGFQVTATPPFGPFHDLRWLLVYHQSWWAFGLGLAALLLFRAGVTAALVRAAWPASRPMPSLARSLQTGLVHAAVAVAVLFVPALLTFTVGAVSLSWLLYAALPPLLVFSLLVHHAAADTAWWRRLPPWRSAVWVLVGFAVLTLGAAAVTLAPWWLVVPAAATAGLFHGWAWYGVVHAVVERGELRRPVPVAPIALAGVYALLVAGLWWGFGAVPDTEATGAPSPVRLRRGLQPVLVVSGFGSDYDGVPRADFGPGFAVRRYSYRGLAASGEPLPYPPAATPRRSACWHGTCASRWPPCTA